MKKIYIVLIVIFACVAPFFAQQNFDVQLSPQQVQTLNKATVVDPVDMTSYIVNQGFDNNDAVGWTGAGTINYHEVEFYQKTFNMYQQISGLPAGKYRLKAKGFERPKLNDAGAAYKAGTEIIYARFYANATDFTELTVPFPSIYKHTYTGTGSLNGYVNNMASAETLLSNKVVSYFDATVSDILLDEGGKLTIGAKTVFQQSGYWALFDNFRLEYLGAYDAVDLHKALNSRLLEAQSFKTKKIQNSALSVLDHAITLTQTALAADSLLLNNLAAVKDSLDAAFKIAQTSILAYENLGKTIDDAKIILGFLDNADEITKLQNAINTALVSYENYDLTLAQINKAATDLKTIYRSVGKQIYVPTWMMGDVNNPANNWSLERSKQSKNWILFWEPGFGSNPGSTVDECLALAEKSFTVYADSLKFINRGTSKTDKYKMIIRLRFSTEWEASGSGVDNTIGLLTLTPWALSSRGGQTIAHEVGHCFQYQTHCDNNDQNGWMYGFGAGTSGGNGWWEQCAQWQAYKVFPSQQFTSEWFAGYMNNVHKHIIHEAPRYENFFIQDFWADLHGKEIIGKLWNKSIKPEDPVEAYKRLTMVTQSQFNDQMYTCAAKFASWDIPALRTYGASKITARPQPKMKNMGDNYWMIDSTVCLENYGHNIIKLNAPTTAKTVTVSFEGKAGANGYRKNYYLYAGWRFGFVAMKYDGTRVYGEMKSAAMNVNDGKAIVSFDCPANCARLWLIVTGAPSIHWRHAWDDNDANDEQWPYQVKFNNTNLLGYTNVINAVPDLSEMQISLVVEGNVLRVNDIPVDANISIFNMQGVCVFNQKINDTSFTKDLSSGMYIVAVKTNQGVFSRKIIVNE